MKTKLLLTLLLGFVLRLEAQHFQIVEQTSFDNEVTATAAIPGGGVYVAVQFGIPRLGFANVRLYRYDAAGNTEWSINLPGSERDAAFDLLVLPDSSLLVCGTNAGCDVGGFGFLARIGADGTVVWHVYEDFTDPQSPVEIRDIAFMTIDPAGVVYTMDYYAIHAFDLNTGAYLDSYVILNEGLGTVNDMHFFVPDQKLYLAGSLGVKRYDVATGTSSQVVALPPGGGGPFIAIVPLGDTAMLTYRYAGEAYVFNGGGVTDSIDWSSHGAERVVRNPDGRLAVQSNGAVHVYGPDYVFQQSFAPILSGLHANYLAWSNNRIVLSGHVRNTDDDLIFNTSHWLQSHGTDGQTFNNTQDVEVMEVIKVQHPAAHFVSWGGFQPYYSITEGVFHVRIRNLSFITLDSVTLNTAFYGFDIPDGCPTSSHIVKSFDSLDLGPGEEVVLDLGLVETPFVPYSVPNPWKVCVWSSMPNGQVDANHTNNLACLNVSGIVSSTEPEVVAFALSPNPATDACTLTWGENLRPERVQLYDLYGRLVHSQAVITASGRHELDLAGLIRGVYVVKTGGGVVRLAKL